MLYVLNLILMLRYVFIVLSYDVVLLCMYYTMLML